MSDPSIVVPVVEERVRVTRVRRPSGGVRLEVQTRDETVEHQDVARIETPVVTREPVDRVLEQPLEPWREGDVLCIPVHEEVVVVRKELRLKEIVRIATVAHEEPRSATVVLQRQQVRVSPLPEAASAGDVRGLETS
jgi:stress response protein YsnF